MSGLFEQGFCMGMTRLSGALGSLAENLRSAATERVEHLGMAWRAEVQRVATALTLSIALAFFVCAAAAFAMFAFMLSLWETHRVLAAWLVTAGFGVLAGVAAILLRNCTRSNASKNG